MTPKEYIEREKVEDPELTTWEIIVWDFLPILIVCLYAGFLWVMKSIRR